MAIGAAGQLAHDSAHLHRSPSEAKGAHVKLRPTAIRGAMVALFVCNAGGVTSVQAQLEPYPNMAPLAEYLYQNPADEIALARSAAPPAISQDADILTLGPKGYETAVKGNNGFVCLVERSWFQAVDSNSFWNPRNRGPDCYNPAAARSVLPPFLKRTGWVLSGLSQPQIAERTKAAVAAHEIPPPELGSMAYMLSRDGYLSDGEVHHWHPHLMFFLPTTNAAAWGAVKDSPVLLADFSRDPVTVFLVPVRRWSDGTPD